jgi:hypothetical protein
VEGANRVASGCDVSLERGGVVVEDGLHLLERRAKLRGLVAERLREPPLLLDIAPESVGVLVETVLCARELFTRLCERVVFVFDCHLSLPCVFKNASVWRGRRRAYAVGASAAVVAVSSACSIFAISSA